MTVPREFDNHHRRERGRPPDRPNLDIVTDAPVHRVRIEHGRCTGVEYSTAAGYGHGRLFRARSC